MTSAFLQNALTVICVAWSSLAVLHLVPFTKLLLFCKLAYYIEWVKMSLSRNASNSLSLDNARGKTEDERHRRGPVSGFGWVIDILHNGFGRVFLYTVMGCNSRSVLIQNVPGSFVRRQLHLHRRQSVLDQKCGQSHGGEHRRGLRTWIRQHGADPAQSPRCAARSSSPNCPSLSTDDGNMRLTRRSTPGAAGCTIRTSVRETIRAVGRRIHAQPISSVQNDATYLVARAHIKLRLKSNNRSSLDVSLLLLI